jgi:FMN-dependent NADH-azoreductase
VKLLHIDSSIQGTGSASRELSAAIVDQLRATHPGLEVRYHDLVADPLPHLTIEDYAVLAGNPTLGEFQNADVIVIGAPLYNFSLPSQLRAWIDRILVSGQTFRYGEAGPEGLAGNKRVIVALTRGAPYAGASPFASFEHAESLLRSVLSFIGVRDPEFVVAEGLALGEEARLTAMTAALDKVRQLAPVEAPAFAL